MENHQKGTTEQQEPLISFLIPTFNSAHTIKRCLDSFSTLSFFDYEVLVADSSSDNTSDIVNKIRESNQRIRLIPNTDFRILQTRINLFNSAKGKYVLFVDSDDCIVSENFSGLASFLALKHPDFLECCYYVETNGDVSLVKVTPSRSVSQFVYDTFVYANRSALCNKIIRRNIVDLVEIDADVHMGEDRILLAYLSGFIGDYSYLSVGFVISFRDVSTSATHTINVCKNCMDFINSSDYLLSLAISRHINLQNVALSFWSALADQLVLKLKSGRSKGDFGTGFKKKVLASRAYKQYAPYFNYCRKQLNLKRRIILFLFRIFGLW